MKKLKISGFSILFLICIFAVQNVFSQQTANIKTVEMQSKILNQKRPIHIYTPWIYDERNLVSFDVIYVFDAQDREIFDLVHAASNFVFEQKKFIVVGVSSPAYDDLQYYRNSDYLPTPKKVSLASYITNKPNTENFFRYFKDEVIPYVEKNYRTTSVRYLVGHSLSASFVLDKAVHFPDIAKGYICVSPNLSYDKDRLADDFLKTDFNKPDSNKFLYVSQSNEPETWAKPWGDAYLKVKTFIENTKDWGKYNIVLKEFPECDHKEGYLPSLSNALKSMKNFIDQNPYKLNENSRDVTFKITVMDKSDDAFIVGNQQSLGNWNPSKVKLDKVSDFERQIKLKVQFPLEFKVTKGSWETEATTDQTTFLRENIVINKADNGEIKLKVITW